MKIKVTCFIKKSGLQEPLFLQGVIKTTMNAAKRSAFFAISGGFLLVGGIFEADKMTLQADFLKKFHIFVAS